MKQKKLKQNVKFLIKGSLISKKGGDNANLGISERYFPLEMSDKD